MIADKCFTNEWINARRGQIGKVDPVLLEKSIHAFALLCGLTRSSLPFVFKGGTSLMLLLPAIRRLSIDVDISMETPRAEYEPLLTTIGQTHRSNDMNRMTAGSVGYPGERTLSFFTNRRSRGDPTTCSWTSWKNATYIRKRKSGRS